MTQQHTATENNQSETSNLKAPDHQGEAPGGGAAKRRQGFKAIWLVPLLVAITLTGWVFASPIGASPDDDYHLASIWCANESRSELCAPYPDKPTFRLVLPGITMAPCYVADPEVSAACQNWSGEATPSVGADHGNWIGAYPPVYYAFMNVFATTDVQAAALVMRLFNVALFLVITVALAVLLPRRLSTPLVAGWTITMVPLSAFLIASNNPGSWALIGVGSSWLAALGWFTTKGWRSWSLAGLAALSVLIAAGARTDAAVYSIMGMGIAAVLAFEKSKQYLKKLTLPVALACFAAPFYFTSGYVAVAEGGLNGGIEDSESRNQLAVLAFNLVSIPRLWTGIFGSWGNGWRMETWPGFSTVEFAGLAVFLGLASLGLRKMFKAKALMTIALVGTLYVLPVYILTVGLSVVSENVQPRYLLPLVVILAGLLLITKGNQPLKVGAWHVIPAVILLSVAHTIALYGNLRRYVTGFDVEQLQLGAGAEWWWSFMPLGPDALWIITSASFAIAVSILGRQWLRDSRTTVVA